MTITKELARYVALDNQGAGRCGIGEVALGVALNKRLAANNNLENGIIRAGISLPDSGRTDLHPLVTDLIKRRFNIELIDKKIHLLQEADISPNTIVLVLATDLKSVPSYVFKQAFDVLHAPVRDPFPNLENDLGPAATQIYFYALILSHVVESRFQELGISRNESGEVIPRNLITFNPDNWENEFNYEMFGERPPLKFPSSSMLASMESPGLSPFNYSLGKPPPENPQRSFFEDDWGEASAFNKPWSIWYGR